MKKVIVCFSLILTACNYYTIKNNYMEDVRAGYAVIKKGQCLEFFSFPILGDFPLKFRDKDHQLMSSTLYPPGHYEISQKGDILKQSQPCELDPVKPRDDSESAPNTEEDTRDSSIPLDSSESQGEEDSSKQKESQPVQPNPSLKEDSDENKPQQDDFKLIEV